MIITGELRFSARETTLHQDILPYSSSSGCYWNRCSFCPERAEKNPYVAIPAEQVILDLHWLVHRHQPVLIHLLDNAIPPSLMEAISEHPPGAPWYGFARVTRHLTDPDFCLALKRSGCVMLKLGLESGDQAVLDDLQKGIHLEEASSALKNLKKAGIATYLYLLFGTPPEGQAEARRTREFVVKHHDEIGFLNLAIFNIPIYGPKQKWNKTLRRRPLLYTVSTIRRLEQTTGQAIPGQGIQEASCRAAILREIRLSSPPTAPPLLKWGDRVSKTGDGVRR
jgi:radical SAM superfamily enzyme YgiQ (UPF0313 family)